MLQCYRLLRAPVCFWSDMDIFPVCIARIMKYFEKCPDVRLFRDSAQKPRNMRNTVTIQHPCALQRYATLKPPVTPVTLDTHCLYDIHYKPRNLYQYNFMLDPDQLITLALEGASVKTLAAEFEISERHVRRILEPVKDQLLPKEARSKPLTDADIAHIRQMRDEGQTESDILTTFHIDHATYRSL